MTAAREERLRLDAASVDNARTTLLQLLARAGVYSGDAEELIGLVEAGALAVAHEELAGAGRQAPPGSDEPYSAGWRDGSRAVTEGLAGLADRALGAAVAEDAEAEAEARPRVGRMEVERAKVAVVPLYLSFSEESDLDPEVTEQVLASALATMGARQRAAYPGRLTSFAADNRTHLERLYATYGPGSAIAIHGRYTLVHSPTSLAVLERLAARPAELREEWDAAELPPAWLDGLTRAWDATA
ncbi:hypothetical protein HHL19_23940 [Streptomyces sp. R302]|uniref:hypothetical protein n=1 Tax=unclassified Streptomyces TaxID=2593676 RepID=UPI00145CB9A8|nr:MULTISPECIES: hypothetical protein [unclassified Streptomyces]NML52000.1 hypothetical protein [Streptomyces sp. R301]NML81620.1 hypothetical protein [Streptomyces sp. R302]